MPLSSNKHVKFIYSVTNKEAYIRGQNTSFKVYSEKATNVCEISTIDLSYVVTVKSTLEISQNFVAFSEYTFNLVC